MTFPGPWVQSWCTIVAVAAGGFVTATAAGWACVRGAPVPFAAPVVLVRGSGCRWPVSDGSQAHTEDGPKRDAAVVVVFEVLHADLLGHPPGGDVVRVDDRYQLGCVQLVSGEVSARSCGLTCVALALVVSTHVVAHLEHRSSVDLLPRQPAVSNELAFVSFDDPQAVAVLRVVVLVPLDPTRDLTL